jgi:hypothetical protein
MPYYISRLDPVDGSLSNTARVLKRIGDYTGLEIEGEVFAVFKNRSDFVDRWNYKTYEVHGGKLKAVPRPDIPKQLGRVLFQF